MTAKAPDEDPFATVQPVAVDRLTPPPPVEIHPAALDLVVKSHDSAQVLEVQANDEGHLKTLIKHLRTAAHSEGLTLRTKIDGLTLRFKAAPKTSTAPDATAETDEDPAE